MDLDLNISNLSDHLFWDVDKTKITWEKHPEFLVERVLDYGLDKDWQILKGKFGIMGIADIAIKLRYLDDVSLHFISTISGFPLNQFRCYKLRQLIPHYSGY